jgi:hypothetical protein
VSIWPRSKVVPAAIPQAAAQSKNARRCPSLALRAVSNSAGETPRDR